MPFSIDYLSIGRPDAALPEQGTLSRLNGLLDAGSQYNLGINLFAADTESNIKAALDEIESLEIVLRYARNELWIDPNHISGDNVKQAWLRTAEAHGDQGETTDASISDSTAGWIELVLLLERGSGWNTTARHSGNGELVIGLPIQAIPNESGSEPFDSIPSILISSIIHSETTNSEFSLSAPQLILNKSNGFDTSPIQLYTLSNVSLIEDSEPFIGLFEARSIHGFESSGWLSVTTAPTGRVPLRGVKPEARMP